MMKIFFSIARYESDCHGGGYYEDLAPDDDFFDDYHLDYQTARCVESKIYYGGKNRNKPILDKWELSDGWRLVFAGAWPAVALDDYTLVKIATRDRMVTLYSCSFEQWQTIYDNCVNYGILHEWELKTFYDNICYKRVILDYKGDC